MLNMQVGQQITDVENAMMMQFCRPPTVRGNPITFLVIVDPFDSNTHQYFQVLGVAFQLMQSYYYPVRLWIVLANDENLKHCRQEISTATSDHDHYYLKKYQGKNVHRKGTEINIISIRYC